MIKKYIVQFLKEKRRGVYSLIVDTYADTFCSMNTRMALQIVKDDLEKETGITVELSYHSLIKAVAKCHKKVQLGQVTPTDKKFEFKDAYEIKDSQLGSGRFKIEHNG